MQEQMVSQLLMFNANVQQHHQLSLCEPSTVPPNALPVRKGEAPVVKDSVCGVGEISGRQLIVPPGPLSCIKDIECSMVMHDPSLQKDFLRVDLLLYYCQTYYMVIFRKPFFAARIIKQRNRLLVERNYSTEMNNSLCDSSTESFVDKRKLKIRSKFILGVMDIFKRVSTDELLKKVCSEDAWQQAGGNKEMSLSAMYLFYAGIAERHPLQLQRELEQVYVAERRPNRVPCTSMKSFGRQMHRLLKMVGSTDG
jgi:hypothetical protein